MCEIGLIWDQADSSVFWRLIFSDRVCDCQGKGVDAFNYAKVILNPVSLEVVELDLQENVPEREFEKLAIK